MSFNSPQKPERLSRSKRNSIHSRFDDCLSRQRRAKKGHCFICHFRKPLTKWFNEYARNTMKLLLSTEGLLTSIPKNLKKRNPRYYGAKRRPAFWKAELIKQHSSRCESHYAMTCVFGNHCYFMVKTHLAPRCVVSQFYLHVYLYKQVILVMLSEIGET